jgi:hypothetical protein
MNYLDLNLGEPKDTNSLKYGNNKREQLLCSLKNVDKIG